MSCEVSRLILWLHDSLADFRSQSCPRPVEVLRLYGGMKAIQAWLAKWPGEQARSIPLAELTAVGTLREALAWLGENFGAPEAEGKRAWHAGDRLDIPEPLWGKLTLAARRARESLRGHRVNQLATALQAADAATQADRPAAAGTREKILESYAGRGASEKLDRLVEIVESGGTADEKLEAMHEVLAIPLATSSRQLADVLGVSHTAIQGSKWWKRNRTGKADEAAAAREQRLRDRADSIGHGEL